MEKQWVEGQGLMVKDSDISLNAGLLVLLKQWDAEADKLMKSSKLCDNSVERVAYKGTALRIRRMMQEVIDVIMEKYVHEVSR